MQLHVLDLLPEGLFKQEPRELHTMLPGPTLIKLKGEGGPPVFISTLLHGDETTGFLALRIVLEKYLGHGQPLPRDLILFLGNVNAARSTVRHLEDEPDFNRIWNGGEGPHFDLARQVVEEVTGQELFATVDVHNSSGKNPHYACLNILDPKWINLARGFSDILVYFTRPDTVLSNAFSRFGPAVTLECGQSGELHGIQHVAQYLDNLLNLESIPDQVNGPRTFDVYHTLGRLEVPPDKKVEFHKSGNGADFCFLEQLDLLNFQPLPAGTLIGWRANPDLHMRVVGENGQEAEGEFLQYIGNEIRLARPLIPSMLTVRPEAVHQDCLGYIMEPMKLPF